jgi:hypothetical protein
MLPKDVHGVANILMPMRGLARQTAERRTADEPTQEGGIEIRGELSAVRRVGNASVGYRLGPCERIVVIPEPRPTKSALIGRLAGSSGS